MPTSRPKSRQADRTPLLPTEIWDLIFGLVKQSTLRDLNLTCKKFSAIARPSIFRTVIIRTQIQLKELPNTGDEILALISTLELAFDWDEEWDEEPWSALSPSLVRVLPRLSSLKELILDDRFTQASEAPVVTQFFGRRLPFDPIPPVRRSPTSAPHAYLTFELLLAIRDHPQIQTLRHSQLAFSDLNLSDEAYEDLPGDQLHPIALPFLRYDDDKPGPPLSLLLSLLHNFHIRPQEIEIHLDRDGTPETARALVQHPLLALETVRLNVWDYGASGPSSDLDLVKWFKALAQQPCLRTIAFARRDSPRRPRNLEYSWQQQVVAALAGIPGLEAFAYPRTSALLADLHDGEFAFELSPPDAEGKRTIRGIKGVAAFESHSDLIKEVFEIFPHLEVLDIGEPCPSTCRQLPHSRSSLEPRPIFTRRSQDVGGLKTLILPGRPIDLVPDLLGRDMRMFCRHHSHLVPPSSSDDIVCDTVILQDIADEFEAHGGPIAAWLYDGLAEIVREITSVMTTIPSLQSIRQPLHFRPDEVVTFSISKDSTGEWSIITLPGMPDDSGYACPCDLEKYESAKPLSFPPLSLYEWFEMHQQAEAFNAHVRSLNPQPPIRKTPWDASVPQDNPLSLPPTTSSA